MKLLSLFFFLALLFPIKTHACGTWSIWDKEMGWSVQFNLGATYIHGNYKTKLYRYKYWKGKRFKRFEKEITIHKNNIGKKNFVHTRKKKNRIKIADGSVNIQKKSVGKYQQGKLELGSKDKFTLSTLRRKNYDGLMRYRIKVNHNKKLIMKGKAMPLCDTKKEKLEIRDIETRLVLYFVWRKHMMENDILVKRIPSKPKKKKTK
jgi:hypothetical protein